MSDGLYLHAAGMVTSVGHTLEDAFTSIHAGIARFRETHLVGLEGRRLLASPVMPVSRDHVGLARALALARPALRECLAGRRDPPPPGRTALLLCTSRREAQPAWDGLGGALAAELDSLGVDVPEALRFQVERGHAGGMIALSRARELLDAALADECLLAGVDSQCEPDVLQVLDLVGWTKSSRARSGYIPGEAAVVLCLRAHGPGARIAGWSFAEERAPLEGRPSTGSALTAAAAHAIDQWGGAPRALAHVYADLNGERGRAKEWAMTASRTLWGEGVQPELVHPADCVGDLGAAAMPLLTALAARRLSTLRNARERSATAAQQADAELGAASLVLASSSTALRGAAVVLGARERE